MDRRHYHRVVVEGATFAADLQADINKDSKVANITESELIFQISSAPDRVHRNLDLDASNIIGSGKFHPRAPQTPNAEKQTDMCVQNNEASTCSRVWENGYDPRVHRAYHRSTPNSKPRPENQSAGALTGEGVVQDAPVPVENTAAPQRPLSSYPSFHDITTSTRPPSSMPYGVQAPVMASNNVLPIAPQPLSNPNPSSRDIEKQYLQTLLPTTAQIRQLVEYHEVYLLWYHGCVHGPSFRRELQEALQVLDGIQLRSLDLRWAALLFAIMTASLTCANDSVVRSWGFGKAYRRNLCVQWYEASLSCLHLGDYTAKSAVFSIQAIQVLSMSAHTTGFSNRQYIIFGAAVKIAQNLGLQRLAYNPKLDEITNITLSPSQKEQVLQREVGRRIWTQMCIQDWFSIPSSDMYSINRQHFTACRPRRIDDESLRPADDRVPLGIDLGNLLYEIALLMAQFHDSIIALPDLGAEYDQVLMYDSKMRALNMDITSRSSNAPMWARWAKSVATIVQAHKIIMIHRSFLGKSFTDPKYTYTRWASVAASKTIVREAETAATDVKRPALWHDQAHMVGACITLCLDALHRSELEPEYAEHRNLVDRAVLLLKRYDDSTLALRGTRLLSSLLEGTSKQLASKSHARLDQESRAPTHEDPTAWPLEDRQQIDAMWARKQSEGEGGLPSTPAAIASQRDPQSCDVVVSGGGAVDDWAVPLQHPQALQTTEGLDVGGSSSTGPPNDGLSDMSWWTDLFSDYFPAQSGFENPFLIEDLFPQAP
ncbi:MAG: hypothetical protein Q9220_001592 [cf. Caloplaca sp. 1 TL-2023]